MCIPRPPRIISVLVALLLPSWSWAQDLVVTDVDVSALVTDCQTLEATGSVGATIRNDGGSATGGTFTVLFFEDQNGNGTYEAGTDVVFGAATAGPLAAGADETVSVPIAASVTFAGNLVFAFADSDDDIAEASETNNVEDSGASCIVEPSPGPFSMVEEWNWNASPNLPAHNHVMMTPVVVNLTDDDGDGLINDQDIPDVVFSSFAGASYFQDGVVRAVHGDTGAEIFTTPLSADLDVLGEGSIAVGDIDGDGLPEIIANEDISETFDTNVNGRLIVFEHDGTFKFKSDVMSVLRWGGASIADLNGDGTPEIVAGRYVFDNTGAFLAAGNSRSGDNHLGPLSTVADIDLDGDPEIVAGFTVYGIFTDGSNNIVGVFVEWNAVDMTGGDLIGDGFPGVANFDADPEAEVVVVSSGKVWLIDDDGVLIWGPSSIPGGGRGGAPNIDDFDGDGLPEIGTAGGSNYAVFDTDGSLLWSSPTQDNSSNVTGSSVFDFEADGAAEVIYKDETMLRVYRGTDGLILAEVATGSGTTYENPVVADVDRDGNAEIIVCANDYVFGTKTGIQVFGDASDNWVDTRRIWNQHTYHITNVADDATIPTVETSNWLTFNNFRSQSAASGQDAFAAPDLTASHLREDRAPCPAETGLVARVGNGGSNLVAAGIDVAFYEGDPSSGGTLLGVVQTTVSLNPGEFEDVTLVVAALSGPLLICAVADDDGAGGGAQSECDETNNKCCATFETFCLDPPVCDAGGPYGGVVDSPIEFDGTGSSDPDGGIVTYDWMFGDGGVGSGPTPSHVYAAPGPYTVTLTVTDDDGLTSTCEAEVLVDVATPVLVSSMEAGVVDGSVVLRWRTERVSGIGFHVHRRNTEEGGPRVRVTDALVRSAGDVGAYTFEDPSVLAGREYDYWLEAVNAEGTDGFHGPIHVTVGRQVPSVLALHAARPNPFNPTTTISFGLPEATDVSLTIFGANGRAVRVLVDASLGAGHHAVTWDGQGHTGHRLGSGVYLVRLEASGEVHTRKIVLSR